MIHFTKSASILCLNEAWDLNFAKLKQQKRQQEKNTSTNIKKLLHFLYRRTMIFIDQNKY